MPVLTIAVAQINAVVGDIAGNLRRLRDAALRARARSFLADLGASPR